MPRGSQESITAPEIESVAEPCGPEKVKLQVSRDDMTGFFQGGVAMVHATHTFEVAPTMHEQMKQDPPVQTGSMAHEPLEGVSDPGAQESVPGLLEPTFVCRSLVAEDSDDGSYAGLQETGKTTVSSQYEG